MPFTLAHPAAAVPLHRLGLPLSALAIGSMSPDFVYFIPWPGERDFGHSLSGFFLFSLPAGLLGFILFQGLLKFPMLSLLPEAHLRRLIPLARAFRVRSAKEIAFVLVALFLGAATHIVWDSFTHAYGWPVRAWPMLGYPLAKTGFGTLYLYKGLQYASGILGMAALGLAYRRWYRTASPDSERLPFELATEAKRRLLFIFVGVAAVLALTVGVLRLPPNPSNGWAQNFVRNAIVSGMAAFVVQLVGYSLIWQAKVAKARTGR
ncbi:DUF4184 family protein [bacterium]|nr:MAG: DUF4184 family protein [bacterium]